jgi:hypothetical protein
MLLNEELLGGGEFEVAVAPPYTKRLNSVASGGNGAIRYVAVGDEGSIISSSDGKTWFKRVSTTTVNLEDVKWITNYNYWLAIGERNVCYSVDGITWNSWQFTVNTNGRIDKIMQPTYTKDTIWLHNSVWGTYFKKQASYSSISSPTGWTQGSYGWAGGTNPSVGYDYVTDFMLLGGDASGYNNTLHYSKNLTSFGGFNISSTGANISDIAFDNYGGIMLVGTDTYGPTRVVTTVASTDATYNVAVWNSTNNPRAADFKTQPALTTDPGFVDHAGALKTNIAYGEIFTDRLYSIWVIVSAVGKIAYTTYPITNVDSYYLNNYYSYAIPKLYTNNGLTWTNANVSTIDSPVYNNVTYGGGQFIAVGSYGLIVTSSDGVNWACRNDNVTKTCVF